MSEKKSKRWMTDEEIMKVYAADKKAGAELMLEKYKDYIYKFLWTNYRTFMHDSSAADELFNSCVVGMMRAMQTYDPSRGAFMTIGIRYMKHEASDQKCFIMKEKSRYFAKLNETVKRAKEDAEEDDTCPSIKKIAEFAGVSEKIADRELKISDTQTADIEACAEPGCDFVPSDDLAAYEILGNLSAFDQKMIVMKVLQGFTYKEIGKKMGKEEGEIKKRYSKCMTFLRAQEANGHV